MQELPVKSFYLDPSEACFAVLVRRFPVKNTLILPINHGIQPECSVPEMTHELNMPYIVLDIGGYRSTRNERANEFCQRIRGLVNEFENKP